MSEAKIPARDLDRTGWGAGPWDQEDDRYEWRHLGFPCLIVRANSGGLCGYVGVPEGHPWHGENPSLVRVHGGITYTSLCAGHICHLPQPGEADNVWWVGFDCNHSGDFAPAFASREKRLNDLLGDDAEKMSPLFYRLFPVGTYRTASYVKTNVESLARQAERAK